MVLIQTHVTVLNETLDKYEKILNKNFDLLVQNDGDKLSCRVWVWLTQWYLQIR